jgi:hypothetical protein
MLANMRRALLVVTLAACHGRQEAETAPEKSTTPRGDEVAPRRFTTSKIDIARIIAKKYAFEAYAEWAVNHPDKECPATIDELEAYMSRDETRDPWGNPYRMFCGASLPPGAKGMAVLSLGEDGKQGTADDIKSWE